MDQVTFEDLEQSGNTASKKPFFAINLDSDSEVLNWLKAQLSTIRVNSFIRLEKIKNNYLRYKGIQYLNQVYQPRDVPETRKRYMPQVVVPLLRDAVDEKVARLMELKPSVVVNPVHDEERDKVDAKIAKRFLKHIEYVNDLDSKLRDLVKKSKIAGESFLITRWNPDAGEELSAIRELKEAGEKVVSSVNVGDVEHIVESPMRLFYEQVPSKRWEDVNYCFFLEYVYTEGLKRDYPSKENEINAEKVGIKYFDYENMEETYAADMTVKITFWHRKTKYLPEGCEAIFVNGALLKKGPLPYNHGKLPIDRLVDGQNEEELAGESFMEHTRAYASQVSNLTNSIIKQQMLCSNPKWFVQAGSVDEQLLNNDIAIVKVKAGAPNPILAQSNPVSPQLMEMRSALKQEFYEMAKSNSVIRGEPPPGVTAFVALQYVSESESRRLQTDVANLQAVVRSIYDKTLKVAGQYYKPDDKRTMWVIGKDNQFLSMKYDPKTLSKPYNVNIQNMSSLPDSKAMRTQLVLDMAQRFPDLLPREQVVEMIGLGQGEKMLDVASAAARAAEDENEMMLDGKGMIEPAVHEDLVTHWKVHTQAIQDTAFKLKVSPEIQQVMKDHIMATEMLMAEQAKKSPVFAQILQTIPQFPMFFDIVSVEQKYMEAQMEVQAIVKQKELEQMEAMQAGAQPTPQDIAQTAQSAEQA